MSDVSTTRTYEGLGRDASDLIKITSWADNDPRKLARLYLRYPRARRINTLMVCRFLDEEWREAHDKS